MADNNNDVEVYIAFNSSNDAIEQVMQNTISTAIRTVFDEDEFEYVSADKLGNFIEVIFKFPRPLSLSEEENTAFFEKLRSVFSITSTMSPRFTNIKEH